MAVSLVFQTTPAQIDSITLDASVNEGHSGEVEVTEHQVETGAAISDHARPKAETLSITGIVSNSPIGEVQSRRVAESGGVDPATGEPRNAQVGYAEEAYRALRAIKDEGRLVTIVTSLRTYDNMIMTALSVPRDRGVGDALNFTASFKQIRLVTSKRTTVVVAHEPKANPKKTLGKFSATATGSADENKSPLLELTDTVGISPEKVHPLQKMDVF